MKKLADDLKRMLTGLAHQHESEFLPMRAKLKTLGVGKEAQTFHPHNKPRKRISLVSDGRFARAPLDYAVQTCERLSAQLDLLIYGPFSQENLGALTQQLDKAHLAHEHIVMSGNITQSILNYIRGHPSIAYLIGRENDPEIRALVEIETSLRNARLPVPLVLVKDNSGNRFSTASTL